MTTEAKPPIPFGWSLSGSKPHDYEAGIDTQVFHTGTRSAYLKHAVDQPEEFGTLMQELAPDDYLGKRLAMTGWLKTDSVHFWASLWLSVYGPAGRINISFDNMCDRRVTGTTDWMKYDIVLDVPTESTKIGFGAILAGRGKLWLDDIAFDQVGNDVLITDCPCSERRRSPAVGLMAPLRARNLNFEDHIEPA